MFQTRGPWLPFLSAAVCLSTYVSARLTWLHVCLSDTWLACRKMDSLVLCRLAACFGSLVVCLVTIDLHAVKETRRSDDEKEICQSKFSCPNRPTNHCYLQTANTFCNVTCWLFFSHHHFALDTDLNDAAASVFENLLRHLEMCRHVHVFWSRAVGKLWWY